jgi:hypothetical protein
MAKIRIPTATIKLTNPRYETKKKVMMSIMAATIATYPPTVRTISPFFKLTRINATIWRIRIKQKIPQIIGQAFPRLISNV